MQPFYHISGRPTIRKFASPSDDFSRVGLAVVKHGSDDAAEHRSGADITHRFAAIMRQIGLERVSQVHEGKRLQPHASRSCERGEKDAVTAKEHVADALDARDVEADVRLERADVAGMNAQRLAGLKVAHDDLAAQLQPCGPIAVELLQQESVAAEDARAERLLEAHPQLNLRGGAEETMTVNQKLVSGSDLNGQNMPGNLGCESDLAGITLRRVLGHEEAAPAHYTFERAEESAAAHHLGMRGHADGLGHPAKLAGLRDHTLTRLQQHIQHRHGRSNDSALHRLILSCARTHVYLVRLALIVRCRATGSSQEKAEEVAISVEKIDSTQSSTEVEAAAEAIRERTPQLLYVTPGAVIESRAPRVTAATILVNDFERRSVHAAEETAPEIRIYRARSSAGIAVSRSSLCSACSPHSVAR